MLFPETGATSNAYGFYSLTLGPGPCTVCCSFLGFRPDTMEIDLKERLTLGLERAVRAVDSGAALELLDKWAALTQVISAS